jgi:electron transport complex protein RnfD
MINFIKEKGTFLKSDNNNSKIMRDVLIALFPIILFAFYKNGYVPYSKGLVSIYGLLWPLIMILVAVLSSIFFEMMFYFLIKKKHLRELFKTTYSFMPGLFLALILPINTPIYLVVLGSFFAIIFGKMLYGGFGQNIFNPALIGRLFLVVSFPLVMASSSSYFNPFERQIYDGITSVTPLSNTFLNQGYNYNDVVAPYGSIFDFIFGNIPGSLGETSGLLILIGLAYLIYRKAVKWRIPLVYLLTSTVLLFSIAMFKDFDLSFVIFHLFSGGLLFGASFMATDPVTSPVNKWGQVLYGAFLGILTISLRFITKSPESVMISILTMNIFVYFIDQYAIKINFNFNKILKPVIAIWLLLIVIPIYIATSYNEVESKIKIVDKTINNNVYVYRASTRGYVDNIVLDIKIIDGNIEEIVIVEQKESFFSKIEDANYLNLIIQNQSNIKDLDAVSQATYTSTAIKEIVIYVMEEYKNER